MEDIMEIVSDEQHETTQNIEEQIEEPTTTSESKSKTQYMDSLSAINASILRQRATHMKEIAIEEKIAYEIYMQNMKKQLEINTQIKQREIEEIEKLKTIKADLQRKLDDMQENKGRLENTSKEIGKVVSKMKQQVGEACQRAEELKNDAEAKQKEQDTYITEHKKYVQDMNKKIQDKADVCKELEEHGLRRQVQFKEEQGRREQQLLKLRQKLSQRKATLETLKQQGDDWDIKIKDAQEGCHKENAKTLVLRTAITNCDTELEQLYSNKFKLQLDKENKIQKRKSEEEHLEKTIKMLKHKHLTLQGKSLELEQESSSLEEKKNSLSQDMLNLKDELKKKINDNSIIAEENTQRHNELSAQLQNINEELERSKTHAAEVQEMSTTLSNRLQNLQDESQALDEKLESINKIKNDLKMKIEENRSKISAEKELHIQLESTLIEQSISIKELRETLHNLNEKQKQQAEEQDERLRQAKNKLQRTRDENMDKLSLMDVEFELYKENVEMMSKERKTKNENELHAIKQSISKLQNDIVKERQRLNTMLERVKDYEKKRDQLLGENQSLSSQKDKQNPNKFSDLQSRPEKLVSENLLKPTGILKPSGRPTTPTKKVTFKPTLSWDSSSDSPSEGNPSNPGPSDAAKRQDAQTMDEIFDSLLRQTSCENVKGDKK